MTSRDEDVVAVSRYFVLCLKTKNEIKIVHYADISLDQIFLTCFRKTNLAMSSSGNQPLCCHREH